jgi:predicted RNA-binding protein with PIN domain
MEDASPQQILARLRTVVDGYNLLFVSGAMGKIKSGEELQRARNRLLDLMLDYLPAEVADRTTVVFDAPKRGREEVVSESYHGRIRVLIADQHAEADDLIEEIIRNHPQPRRLTVVSGDQRLRRAARRRRADDVDSESWWTQLEAGVPFEGETDRRDSEKGDLDQDDTDWFQLFTE